MVDHNVVAGLVIAAIVLVLTGVAIWQRERKNPDGTNAYPRPDLFEGLEEAAKEYHANEAAERAAVLRGREVQEQILAELKRLRRSSPATVGEK